MPDSNIEPTTQRRALLPFLADGHSGGSRSAMTCIYRCGNACAHPAPNTTENEYLGDIATAAVSRRGVLQAAGAGALVLGTGAGSLLGGQSAAAAETSGMVTAPGSELSFKAVAPNKLDALVLPPGYSQHVIIRWGEAVLPGAPAFDIDNQTPEAQAMQFGYNNDYVWFLALRDRDDLGLLVVNHEYTNEELMFRGYTSGDTATEDQVRIAQMAHGLSVVLVRRSRGGEWRPVVNGSRYNRRITAQTPMRLTGPAAGSDFLKTALDSTGKNVLGTLNNCAGGLTPWGTILTAEENFNQYFAGGDGAPEADKPRLARYGIPTTSFKPAFGYRGWEKYDERFNLTLHPNEANRHGYIVEIDPADPGFTPLKRTALGRFKHEGADISLASDGRVVAYMGDDERFDYLYKYVSDEPMRTDQSRGARRHNLTLLDNGTLYVAKLTGNSPPSEIDGTGTLPSDGAFDGTGEWIALAQGSTSFVEGMTAEEVYVFTRLAADKAGATKMDRPEEVQTNPRTGAVYLALTNNSARQVVQVDEPNPRPFNRHGQVLELVDAGSDGTALTFGWNLLLVCGDPSDPSTYFAGFDKSKVSPISCPDNLGFDAAGNLWIATDGNALGSNDGFFAVSLEGPNRGLVKQFLSVPVGSEACGLEFTPDMQTVFVAVQHPGEVTGASVDNPASVWPDGEYARPAVVGVWRSASGSKRIGV
ncbi:MAG: PhoX family phosphatase [Candidatus Nanopelagicales bacterium]|nr:PhoX family phosphatase [Candidatus Nanopelagicales bacterium]